MISGFLSLLTHLSVILFGLTTPHSFSLIGERTRLWSLPVSAPLYVLVSVMERLKWLLIVMWPIWFLYLPFGNVQVYLCGETGDVIILKVHAWHRS